MLSLINPRVLSATSKLIKLTVFFRNTNSGQTVENSTENHIFKKLWTKHELIEHLCSSVHYEDEYYIVLNKPYGVLSRFNKAKKELEVREGASCESTVTDILPDLSARFGTENLSIVVNPEKYFSGVVILSKNSGSNNGLLKDFYNIPQSNSTYSFLAIVSPKPPASVKETFRVHFNKEQNSHELVKKSGKKGAKNSKKFKTFKINYSHEVLSSSEHASLVKVDLDLNFLHCLRLVLATQYFTPVLGDAVYTPRVTTLFGVSLLVPPNINSNTRKILPPEIVNLLQLSPEDIDCCPCHIHLYSMMFRVKEKRFVACAPPPEYFVFTCERLGLEIRHFLRGFDCANYTDCREAVVASN